MPDLGSRTRGTYQEQIELERQQLFPETEDTFLDKAGFVLGIPSSMLAYTLEGENPLDAFKRTRYVSDALGIKNPSVALITNLGIDPLNFIGGVGLAGKLGNLKNITKIASKAGIDLNKLVKVGKSFNKVDDLITAIPNIVKTDLSVINKAEKALESIPRLEGILGKLSNVKKAGMGKKLESLVAAGVDPVNSKRFKRLLSLSNEGDIVSFNKAINSMSGNYKRLLGQAKGSVKASEELTELVAKRSKNIENLFANKVGESLGLEDVKQIQDVFDKSGKFAEGLSAGDRIRLGFSGVGVSPSPFGFKAPFKAIAPELQAKIADKTSDLLKGIPEVLGKVGNKRLREVGEQLRVALTPQEKYLKKLDDAIRFSKQGRGQESELVRDISSLGRISQATSNSIVETLATGGRVTDKMLESLKAMDISPEMITALSGNKEIIGLSRIPHLIAEKLGAKEVNQISEIVAQIYEKPDWVEKMRKLTHMPAWDKSGMDLELMKDVYKYLADPQFKRTFDFHQGMMNHLFSKEQEIAALLGKGGASGTEINYVKNYLMHSLKGESFDILSKQPDQGEGMRKAILSWINSSFKNRKLVAVKPRHKETMYNFLNGRLESGLSKTSTNKLVKEMMDKTGLKTARNASEIRSFMEGALYDSSRLSGDKKKFSTLYDNFVQNFEKKLYPEGKTDQMIKRMMDNDVVEHMSSMEANNFSRKTFGKDMFKHDFSEILADRMGKHYESLGRYHYTEEMGEELVNLGLAKNFSGDVPKGFTRGEYGKFKNYVFNDETFDLINKTKGLVFEKGKVLAAAKEQGVLGSLINLNQGFIKHWKKWTTMPFSSYHIRNFVGNNVLMWEAGMSPADIIKYTSKYGKPAFVGTMKKGEIVAESLPDLVTKYGKVIKGVDIENAAKAYGIPNSGFYRSEVAIGSQTPKGFVDSVSEATGIKKVTSGMMNAATTMGAAIEDSAKMATFAYALEKGMDFKDAAKFTLDTLFDYSNVPRLVGAARKNVFPFLSWSYYNIPKQIVEMSRRPYMLNSFTKTRSYTKDKGMGRFAPYEDEFGKRKFSIYMPGANPLSFITGSFGNKTSGQRIALDGWLPQFDVGGWVDNPVDSVMNLLSPSLKLPIEYSTNKKLFSGKEIKKHKGQKINKFGVAIDPNIYHALESTFRAVPTLERLLPDSFKGTKTEAGAFNEVNPNFYGKVPFLSKAAGTVTGMKTYAWDAMKTLTTKKYELQRVLSHNKRGVINAPASSATSKRNNRNIIILKAQIAKIDEQLKALKSKGVQ